MSDEFRVNPEVLIVQKQPAVAAAPDGSFVIAWHDQRDYTDLADIYAQRYGADGNPIDAAFRVNTVTSYNQYWPSIGMSADGSFVIGWTSEHSDGWTNGVFARRYAADGTAQGDQQQLNLAWVGDQSIYLSGIASAPDGRFIAVWHSGLDGSTDYDIVSRRFAADGSALSGEDTVNTFTTGFQGYSTVSVASDGGYVVAWVSAGQDGSGWGIYGREFGPDGDALTSEIRLNSFTDGDQSDPRLAVGLDDRLFAVWTSAGHDGSGLGVVAEEITWDTNGAPIANPDTATVSEDSSVVISLLANDSDPEGFLSLSSWPSTTAGGRLEPVSGSDGSLQYIPDPDFNGIEQFSYTVEDSSGITAVATVTVTVTPQNDPVRGFQDAYSVIYESIPQLTTSVVNGLLANDFDVDGGPLYVSSVNTSGLVGSLMVNPDGTFEYNGPYLFEGVETFSYTVSDGVTFSGHITVKLVVHEGNWNHYDDPQVADDWTVIGDQPLAGNVRLNDAGGLFAVVRGNPGKSLISFGFDGSYQLAPGFVPTDIGLSYVLIGATGLADEGNLNAEALKLTIHNGQNGNAVDAKNAVTRGAFTVANKNDTDNDGIQDDVDPSVRFVNQTVTPKGQDEMDLMKLVLFKPNDPAPAPGATVKVTVNGGAALWQNSWKGDSAEVGPGVAEVPLTAFGANGQYTIWIEAKQVSQALRAIEVKIAYLGRSNSVRATGMWAELTRFLNTGALLQNADGTPKPGSVIPADFDNKDTLRFLYTKSLKANVLGASHNNPMKNLMIIEFSLQPPGTGNEKAFVFDISRAKEVRTWTTKFSGGRAIGRNEPFPAFREIPNDDFDIPGFPDEDNVPMNDHIYVFDSPGPGTQERDVARYEQRLNMWEFVRVLVKDSSSGATRFFNVDRVQGSRASDFSPWWSRQDWTRANATTPWSRNPAGVNEIRSGAFPPLGN